MLGFREPSNQLPWTFCISAQSNGTPHALRYRPTRPNELSVFGFATNSWPISRTELMRFCKMRSLPTCNIRATRTALSTSGRPVSKPALRLRSSVSPSSLLLLLLALSFPFLLLFMPGLRLRLHFWAITCSIERNTFSLDW